MRKHRAGNQNKINAFESSLRLPRIGKCEVCSREFKVANNKGRPKTCSTGCREVLGKYRVRNWNLSRKYGLSESTFNQKLIDQDGECAICRKSHLECRAGLFVDHNHTTGQIRDLLCRECNSAIGLFQENKGILAKAVEYLAKHETKTLHLIKEKK